MSVINSFILQYGLISVFVLIMIEYACFPLPSEVVLPLCGAIAARNHFGFLTILILSIIAGILGSIFCYTVGNWGGKSIINKIIEICPKAKKGIFATQDYFNKYSSISVCVCRLIPLCRTYISFIAGIAGQNIITFVISSIVGITIWNTSLISIGYIFSESWVRIMSHYNDYKFLVLIIPISIIFIGFVIKSFIHKKHHKIRL